jgi:hypothetical protein
VRAALEAGSSDNVTVVLAEVCAGGGTGATPAVVGAAATSPHRQLGDDATGNLREGDLAGLDDDVEDLDPEELRYAPRPPRRFGWARRLAVLGALLLVVAGGAAALYSWSQGQYYVSDDGGDVVIFKGVKAKVPGLKTHHVAERTELTVIDLESYDAGRVRSGISADGLTDARRIVADLKVSCPPPTAPATPAPAAPTTAAVPQPTAGTTPPATPAPTPTPTPIPGGSATGSDPCATPGAAP